MFVDTRKLNAYEEELREKYKQGFGVEAPEDEDVMSLAQSKVKDENKNQKS